MQATETKDPTDKQLAFVNVLLAERGQPTIAAFEPYMTRKMASEMIEMIEMLKASPPTAQPEAAKPSLLAMAAAIDAGVALDEPAVTGDEPEVEPEPEVAPHDGPWIVTVSEKDVLGECALGLFANIQTASDAAERVEILMLSERDTRVTATPVPILPGNASMQQIAEAM